MPQLRKAKPSDAQDRTPCCAIFALYRMNESVNRKKRSSVSAVFAIKTYATIHDRYTDRLLSESAGETAKNEEARMITVNTPSTSSGILIRSGLPSSTNA